MSSPTSQTISETRTELFTLASEIFVPEITRLFPLLAYCLLAITVRLPRLQAHDVGNVQPLDFIGYAAPFGNDGATTYTDVWAEGDYAMIGSLESGVAILGIPSSGPVTHVGTFEPAIAYEFQDVKASGGYGFFSSQDGGGTFVVDLVDPTAPASVFQIDSTVGGHDNVRNVTVGGGYLYQVDEHSAVIHVFDISSPTHPQFVRSLDTGDSVGVHDVTLVGNRLYASGLGGNTGEGAVYIYDIANLDSTPPSLLGQIPTGANTSSAWPTNNENLLVVTHRQVGGSLGIWDISNLNQPTLATSADASDLGLSSFSSSEVVILDDILYVAWWEAGVQVLDLDNDLQNNGVQLIGQFDTSVFSSPLDGYEGNQSVFPLLGHDRVLLSDSQWGFHVVNAQEVLPDLPNNGDFDVDDDVDGADFLTWQRGFGLDAGAPGSSGDANNDGKVNAVDLSIWEENFGSTIVVSSSVFSSSTLTVPEPSSQLLVEIAAAVFLLLHLGQRKQKTPC